MPTADRSHLIVSFLCLLVAAASPAAARECREETPLPAGVRVVPPGPGVAAGDAAFSGAWVGAWDARGREGLCQALVVEEILPGGYARVVYSHGMDEALGIHVPEFHRRTASIAGGVLRFRVGWPGGAELTYRVDGSGLASTYQGQDQGRVTRVTDAAEIGCRRRVPAVTPPAGVRDRLTAAELLAAEPGALGPVHTAYFAPLGTAAPPRHAFSGTLRTHAGSIAHARGDCLGLPSQDPGFAAAFFTHGEHLVPVVRDMVDHGQGAIILSPGRVWSEAGDGGMTRAAFPFAVVDRFHNGLRNGLATFLFDDTRVSSLRVQVSQETMFWARFDSWGQLAATYEPAPVADAVRAKFAAELGREAPIRPWAALPASPAMAAFDGDARPPDVSARGLVRDGVIYLRGCETRHGPFPYCRHMRHGVFSVTKSAGAAVALLRLAQKYGAGVLDEKLVDYIPASAARPEWQGVTFAHALGMATGIGDEARDRDANPLADDWAPKMLRFVGTPTRDEKLAIALSFGQYPWKPGEVFRYNSTHTFMLAVAMDAYLKRREGPDAHLWDMVRTEVYRPIGVFHAPVLHTREPGGQRGVPVLGWGLFLTIDDVAKLSTLLQNGGRHDGAQLLHAGTLAQALYRAGAAGGLPSGRENRFGAGRYHLSFWSTPYRPASGCDLHIPSLDGIGGNFLALLPNGVSVFRFADGHHYDLDSMILAGETLGPFCPAPATPPPAAVSAPPLSAPELRALLPGHTLVGTRQRIFVAPDGRLYGRSGPSVDVGTWYIADDGRYCRTWHTWDHGLLRCFRVSRDGGRFHLDVDDRLGRFAATRVPGNALRRD